MRSAVGGLLAAVLVAVLLTVLLVDVDVARDPGLSMPASTPVPAGPGRPDRHRQHVHHDHGEHKHGHKHSLLTVSYANATLGERLAAFDAFDVVRRPWHWRSFALAHTSRVLAEPDPGPSWRVGFDAAAGYVLPPRDRLASRVFAGLAALVERVAPVEPAAEVLPNGPEKSATETMQCLALAMLRIRCLAVGGKRCRMHPAVPADASLEWQFVHGINTYLEDVPSGNLTLISMTNIPFVDVAQDPDLALKHVAPVIVEQRFPLGAVGPRIFLSIIRAPLPRAVSKIYHHGYSHGQAVAVTAGDIRTGAQELDLSPTAMAPAYSKEATPLDVRRRTYYMQTEVLLNPEYKPHVLSDIARFIFGSGADERVVRQAVGMLAKFEVPRMDHGISHPPFTETVTDEVLRKVTADHWGAVPEIIREMYPMPETMAGPFEMRLCNINGYLWELEAQIACDPFGEYA